MDISNHMAWHTYLVYCVVVVLRRMKVKWALNVVPQNDPLSSLHVLTLSLSLLLLLSSPLFQCFEMKFKRGRERKK